MQSAISAAVLLTRICSCRARSRAAIFFTRSGMTDSDQIHWYRTDPWMYRYNILISKPARNRKPVENAFYDFVVNAFS